MFLAPLRGCFCSSGNGEAEQVDFIDSNVTEEEEEELQIDAPTPPLVPSDGLFSVLGFLMRPLMVV